jgi:Radical SAM superfamily
MAGVVLVFPPLVESGFGNLYPSTAVLAAFLQVHGFSSAQIDLNNAFVHHMISDDELMAAASGTYRRSEPLSVAAARWVIREYAVGALSPEDFSPGPVEASHPLRNVRRLLATPYSVDPDRHVLDGVSDDDRLVTSYDRFFADYVGPIVGSADGDALVGISVPMGPQLLPALRLAAVARSAATDRTCRIVLGGPALSLLGDADLTRLLVSHPAVDAIVRMDGEIPLLALAEQVSAGAWEPHRIPGTSSHVGGVSAHVAPAKGPKLNDLPTPHYSDALVAGAPTARLGVTQARGCYWGKCDYCDFVEVFKGSPPYRGRHPELVVDDLRKLVERTGIRRYRLITESIPPAFTRHFAELLCESDLEIGWSSFIMVDRRFDADLLQLMAASGCDYLVVGLESMVTRVLKHVHKSADREENVRFVRDARAAGIDLAVNLIPDLPSTTRDEAMQGLRDLEALADCFNDVHVLRFETTRSSRVGRDPERFGLVPLERPVRRGQAQLTINALPVNDPAMTPDEWTEVVQAYDAFASATNAARTGDVDRTRGRRCLATVDHPDGPAMVDLATMAVGVLQRPTRVAL